MSEVVLMLKGLVSLIDFCTLKDLYTLVKDATRFLIINRSVIEKVPLQIYSSALVFSPKGSRVKSLFQDRIVKWIKTLPAVPVDWGPSFQSLEGHSSGVRTITFSPDGYRLASASYDKTVRLWDPRTGACCEILKGHSGPVWAVAFSPDGHRLASASRDKTVRLWSPRIAACSGILRGHLGEVYAVAFSPDGHRLASTSRDKSVRLWDLRTGACCVILKGHSNWIKAVAFSLDDYNLVATSNNNKIVRLWDIKTDNNTKELCIKDSIHDEISPKTDFKTQELNNLGHSQSQQSPSALLLLYVKDEWVFWKEDNILWLPLEYRPKRYAQE